jgi:KipI family sensor histidine kinase inhibitor
MPRVLPMGERALLAEVDDQGAVLALHRSLRGTRPAGVVDLVPAARTVLVEIDPRTIGLAEARAWIVRAAASAGARDAAEPAASVDLHVRYDGADLARTAALLALAPAELVARHAAAAWTVAFTGFAPGFGYLVSDDWAFDVPRRESPRTRVPAGVVGLAAGFTAAYPRETPGGWQLIGTLRPADAAKLFDPDAAAPALLAPGTRVRFREEPA